MLKNIAVYGASGFGRETACLLREINAISPEWNFVGFFDDGVPAGTINGQGKILGGLDALNAVTEPLSVVFAIAAPRTVKSLAEKISNPLVAFPNIVAAGARLMDPASLKIGKGNLINWDCSVSCDVEFGDFNLLNVNVTIGHDSRIGNFNVFMTGARISGHISIGDENFVALNASIYQGVKIGNNTMIGGNSLVVRDTKDGATYLGIPATQFKF